MFPIILSKSKGVIWICFGLNDINMFVPAELTV